MCGAARFVDGCGFRRHALFIILYPYFVLLGSDHYERSRAQPNAAGDWLCCQSGQSFLKRNQLAARVRADDAGPGAIVIVVVTIVVVIIVVAGMKTKRCMQRSWAHASAGLNVHVT